MSQANADSVGAVNSSEVQNAKAVTTDATTASNAVKANANQADFDANTTISSLEDLRKKAPKVYQKMLEGIAQNICNSMKDHQEHLKELMRQYRDDR